MDFALNNSQALLVDTAKAFFSDRSDSDDEQRLWRDVAELGWPGLLITPAHGGVGGSLLDAVLLMEQFGYAARGGAYVSSAVVGSLVLSAAQRREELAELAAGRMRVALALAEDSGEFTPQSVRLAAVDGAISGEKRFARNAGSADALIVAAREADGISCFLIPREEVGLTPAPTISGEDVFGLTFESVPALVARRLGAPGRGWELLRAPLAAGALARAAEMVGLTQHIVDVVVDYAKIRQQGGQPIGAFQAVQHHCADMLRDLEGARYITYRAASTDNGLAREGPNAAMAKAYASDACLAVARRSHQVMGAIGYCDEHVLHRLHKRIHAAAVDFGDANSHFDAVAEDLGLR